MGPLLHSPCNVRQCACLAGSCATREQSHVVGGCSAPPLLRCPRRPHRPRTVSAGRPRFSFRHTSKNHPKKLLSDVFSRNFQDAHVLCQFLNVWQHPQAAGPAWSAKSQSCRSAPPTRQLTAPSSIFTLKMHQLLWPTYGRKEYTITLHLYRYFFLRGQREIPSTLSGCAEAWVS